jgi:ATP-dependent Clp protease ATP-binding subunit ClpA
MTQSQDFMIYFDDSRLRMSSAGRFLVRVVFGIGHLFFGVLTILLLISDIRGLQFAGIFLLMFWADYLIHYQEADCHLGEVKTETGLNVASYLAPATFTILERAVVMASLAHQQFFVALLKELLRQTQLREVFSRLDVDERTLREKIDSWLSEKADEENPYALVISSPLLVEAFHRARASNHHAVEPGDLMAALFTIRDPYLERLIHTFAVTPENITEALLLSRATSAVPHLTQQHRFRAKRGIMNRSWTSRSTPTLDRFSTDLTEMASEGLVGNLVGHKTEYENLVKALSRAINPNALLVGESGIGKDVLVGHLAADIVNDRVPKPLTDRRIIQLNIANIVANATPEELQGRIQKIIKESLAAGDIILYLPRLHDLLHTSGEGHLSGIDAFIPIFEKESLPIIGSTRPLEFKKFLEPRDDIMAYFEKIDVHEVSIDEAFTMLTKEAKALETEARLTISVSALKKAVTLAKQYLHHRPLPGNALELLKESVEAARRDGKKTLSPEDVALTAEKKIHIPVHRPDKEEVTALLHLEETIHQHFVDQEDAVKSVADALREYRSGLARKNGPIASFLFVGPTGVGKTALSKLLAEIQFGSEDLLIRFDMSEYQDKKNFMQFIGSPDGTILGTLTEAVREKPRSVILLDEFEKAYPDILHLFLQVLDEGRLTDGLGRTVSFEDAIIVATSNAHSRDIEEALHDNQSISQISENFKSSLVDVFTPELLNRFSKIIVFKNLSAEDIGKVAEFELQSFTATLKEKDLRLEFDRAVVEKIAELGYDPAFGARPLRQAIEEHVRAPLAKAMLENSFEKGDLIKASLDGENIIFTKEMKQ